MNRRRKKGGMKGRDERERDFNQRSEDVKEKKKEGADTR